MSATGITIQVCAGCGTRNFPHHLSCAKCGGHSWDAVATTAGTVMEIAVSRRRAGATESAPVFIALVRSDAGPLIIARGEEGLSVGAIVELTTDGTAPVAKPRL